MPLPWLSAWGRLWIIIIVVIVVVVTYLGIPTRPIDLIGILSHLQLEVPSKPD